MVVLLQSDAGSLERWRAALAAEDPALEIRAWPDYGDPSEIDIAVVWDLPPGAFRELPKLKAILCLGMGVDGLMARDDLPAGVPIARLHDPFMVSAMTEYVVLHCLRHHRGQDRYRQAQARAEWLVLPTPVTAGRRIGIMGLGQLGRAAAAALTGLGFPVAGWSRTAKQVAGIDCFAGAAALDGFLGRTDILVCLLPLTPATEGILNGRTFDLLPPGAALINAARGGLVDDDDLIAALDSGRLSGATLDTFHTEPLPADHPYWRHPQVTVTPHAAADTYPPTAAKELVANIRRTRAGAPLKDQVDPRHGY